MQQIPVKKDGEFDLLYNETNSIYTVVNIDRLNKSEVSHIFYILAVFSLN